MIDDYDLFIQLCEKRCISPPAEILEAIKSGSRKGELRLPCISIIVPICSILARVLSSSSSIKHVDLSDCMLLSQGLDSILDALCEGSNITSLNLKGNNINGPVVSHLGNIFLHNNTLKRLSIEWNSLGADTEAFAEFCEGLRMNHNVEELDLRYNQISPHCAEFLSNAFRTNKSLKTIDLSWNTLGTKGGQILFDGLRENRGITELLLRGNCIPDEIVRSIDEHVYRNQCRNLAEQTNITETVKIAKKIIVFTENLDRTKKELPIDDKLPIETRINPVPSKSRLHDDSSKPHNDSLPAPKIVRADCGDVDRSGKNEQESNIGNKIGELNHMLQDRTAAIDLLTKEIGERAEETNASKALISDLENEIRNLKDARDVLVAEKLREIEEVKDSHRKAEAQWQRQCKRLEESLRESSMREKELETRSQRYEREIRKHSIETASLREKSIAQVQSYEDLIAKSRVVMHRVKRETKERENRYKIELNVLKNTLKESTTALEECQAQLQKSRGEMRETSENLSSLKTRLTEIERVNCRLVRIEALYHKIKDEKKLLEEKLLDSQGTIATMQRQVATLQGELIEPQRRYGLVKDELEQEREKSARLKRELSEERARMQEQNSQMQTLNAQITALNNQINEIQNNHVEALRERDKERKILKEIISNKERDFNELKTEEVQRASQLYAAFSKYLGSIGSNTTLQ